MYAGTVYSVKSASIMATAACIYNVLMKVQKYKAATVVSMYDHNQVC